MPRKQQHSLYSDTSNDIQVGQPLAGSSTLPKAVSQTTSKLRRQPVASTSKVTLDMSRANQTSVGTNRSEKSAGTSIQDALQHCLHESSSSSLLPLHALQASISADSPASIDELIEGLRDHVDTNDDHDEASILSVLQGINSQVKEKLGKKHFDSQGSGDDDYEDEDVTGGKGTADEGMGDLDVAAVILDPSRSGSYDHLIPPLPPQSTVQQETKEKQQRQESNRGRPKGVKDGPTVDVSKRGRPKGAKNTKGTIEQRLAMDIERGILPPERIWKKRYVVIPSDLNLGMAKHLT